MAYTKEELFQCICECMFESLPSNWKSASMKVEITGNEIQSNFYFTNSNSSKNSFKPINFIAPMNAAKELKEIMSAEGQDWGTMTITISPEGQYEVSIE
ncbi:hypothetical protein [Spartinivicinus poritis]|uniref:Uncharacterized protein n=1 Tax=Spartinivicinus poritis TaxID=2994640 RepID=A0ABT5UKD4_9GAMM|nr:hypothetical protein [Spartinivicinus sp. A2-2]MDE1465494.1 hypothetical protein [Spartinivicinus sp. A2-2]